LTENSHRVKLYIQHGTGTNLSAEEKLNVLRGDSHQRFEDRIENVQEAKNTKPFHTFHDAKSLYVKLEEGDFRIEVLSLNDKNLQWEFRQG
jgi:hypothetical protein